ncbi:hypothetical protein ES705_40987 [subsurface metagenome]
MSVEREVFDMLVEKKVLVERWRVEYNHIRPHSLLGYRPPAPEVIIPLSAYAFGPPPLHLIPTRQRLTLEMVQSMGAGHFLLLK